MTYSPIYCHSSKYQTRNARQECITEILLIHMIFSSEETKRFPIAQVLIRQNEKLIIELSKNDRILSNLGIEK